MKNKMKKVIAMMLLSVMLLGGVMTAHAATATTTGCATHTGVPTNFRAAGSSVSTHVLTNGITCHITTYYTEYDVYCSNCGAYIGTYTGIDHQVHSVQHN